MSDRSVASCCRCLGQKVVPGKAARGSGLYSSIQKETAEGRYTSCKQSSTWQRLLTIITTAYTNF